MISGAWPRSAGPGVTAANPKCVPDIDQGFRAPHLLLTRALGVLGAKYGAEGEIARCQHQDGRFPLARPLELGGQLVDPSEGPHLAAAGLQIPFGVGEQYEPKVRPGARRGELRWASSCRRSESP